MDAEQTARQPGRQTPDQPTRQTGRRTARRTPAQRATSGAGTKAPPGTGPAGTRTPDTGRTATAAPKPPAADSEPPLADSGPPTAASDTDQTRRKRPTRPPRTGARGALGRYGEGLAARRLTEAGMTILERNWRAGRTGEIDIVAQDGDTLVICEVKTRRAGSFEHPMAAITPAKAERLRRLAERWLQAHGSAPPGGVRIDLVGIIVPDRGAPEAEHARGVA